MKLQTFDYSGIHSLFTLFPSSHYVGKSLRKIRHWSHVKSDMGSATHINSEYWYIRNIVQLLGFWIQVRCCKQGRPRINSIIRELEVNYAYWPQILVCDIVSLLRFWIQGQCRKAEDKHYTAIRKSWNSCSTTHILKWESVLLLLMFQGNLIKWTSTICLITMEERTWYDHLIPSDIYFVTN